MRVCPPRQCSTEEEESPTDTKSISRRESGREKAPRGFHPNTGCMNKILCGEVKHCYAFLKHPVCQMIKSPPRWLLLSDGAFRYTAKTRMTSQKCERNTTSHTPWRFFLFQLYSKSISMFSGGISHLALQCIVIAVIMGFQDQLMGKKNVSLLSSHTRQGRLCTSCTY